LDFFGSRGLVLHFYRKKNELSTFSILAQKPKTGKKYNVFLNEQLKARFSHIEEAVEAVDYEIQKMGTLAIQTALPTAPWRRGEVPHPLEEQLAQLKPPRSARTLGEALHYLSFAQRTLNHSVHKK
jgi:hypothetical protein